MYYLLLITYCLLLTMYYSLLTTYYLPPQVLTAEFRRAQLAAESRNVGGGELGARETGGAGAVGVRCGCDAGLR